MPNFTPFTATHDSERQRFEVVIDGHACVADYRRKEDVVTVTHTGVPRELQGRGIAAELVRQVLEWAETNGLKVIPACSYVQVYMRRHPSTLGLLAQRGTV
jgi:predicted GNAT family acetyltransferase